MNDPCGELVVRLGKAQVDAMFERQDHGPILDDSEFLPLVESVLTAFETAGIDSEIVEELCSRFADLEADCERPGGRNWLCRIDRERVRDRGIRDGRAAQPVRLRSSVSWAIQVFSRDGPGSSPSVFSS
jgi:hypothetical protein